jgi:hypothetical protein
MTTILGAAPRKPIAGAEWQITAQLVSEKGNVLVASPTPLVISDAWLCGTPKASTDRSGRMTEAGRNIATWVDDLAVARSRSESAARRFRK